MKIGFYDSGIGGLSVLKEFLNYYGSNYEYYYFGDSARAPYGDKSKQELKIYVKEILDTMRENGVDLVVSACNTSSMFLHEIDKTDYFFQIISLFDVMNDYFSKDPQASILKDTQTPIALLATSANIDMGRYKDWGLNIYPVKCPELVPLVEAGKITEAAEIWENKLNKLSEDIRHCIIGCTHYSFLVSKRPGMSFIDPARLCLKNFKNSLYSDSLLVFDSDENSDSHKLNLELDFSKHDDAYIKLASRLLSLPVRVPSD